MKKLVTELCPYCLEEVSFLWDVQESGWRAFCPVCGEVMMLCSECDKRCDWDDKTRSCHKTSFDGAMRTDSSREDNSDAET